MNGDQQVEDLRGLLVDFVATALGMGYEPSEIQRAFEGFEFKASQVDGEKREVLH